jgi:muconolactone delta-isomerase
MQYMVRFDVHQPSDMPAEELVSIWNEEAKAALGAVEAGAITGL